MKNPERRLKTLEDDLKPNKKTYPASFFDATPEQRNSFAFMTLADLSTQFAIMHEAEILIKEDLLTSMYARNIQHFTLSEENNKALKEFLPFKEKGIKESIEIMWQSWIAHEEEKAEG